MVVHCESHLAQQILKQVNKLVDVVNAVDLSDANCVERELVLVRVRALQEKRATLLTEAEIFRARVVTATPENYVFEVTGDSGKVEAFLEVVRPYGIEDMVRGDCLFSATGVTDGSLLKGVKFRKDVIETETVVMRSVTGTVRLIQAEHRQLDKFYLD